MSSTSQGDPAERYVPKDVLAFEFNPAKKLAHFLIKLCNVPGASEQSAGILAKNRVNILSGFQHAPSMAEEAVWSFFADLTDAKAEPSQLVKELKSLPTVVDIQFQASSSGFLTDAFHFPLQYGGKRAIMMQAEGMGTIMARVNEIFGGGAAAGVILYEMGEAAGRFIYRNFVAAFGIEVVKRELAQLIGLYRSLGWGILTLQHIDHSKKTATVRMLESFECMHYKGRSSTARGHFVRGHIVGWLSELFEQRIQAAEKNCIAKGDGFCEFVAEPVPK